jgi:bifunctional enzyme CysN/CysC
MALRGEHNNFTVIDSPYVRPEQPDIHIDTTTLSVEAAADMIVERLLARR